MMFRPYRSMLATTGIGFILVASACGGKGSNASVPVAPTAVPTTAPSPVGTSPASTLADCTPGQSTQSQIRRTLSVPTGAATAVPFASYTLTSYPQGATVTRNGSILGTTPLIYTPSYGFAANFITYTEGSSSYTLCLAQTGFQSRTILYNESGDTSGSITSISTSSLVHRSVLSTKNTTLANANLSFARVAHHALRHASVSNTPSSQLLVKYKPAMLLTTNRSISGLESSLGITSAHNLGPQNASVISRVITVPKATSSQALSASLSRDPAVDAVYPVHYRSALSITPVVTNDPFFSVNDLYQWDMYQIQAPQAWALSEGSPSVAIAIIDTGYDPNNPDLAGSKVTYAESSINGVVTPGSAAAQDTDGHGSNVSGIAAADTNNSVSVAGTGFNVSLQEYRIFPNPGDPGYVSGQGASATDEAQAIYDAITHGAKVISLSLGATEDSGIDQSEYDAVEYAISQGITVVAAAGNEHASGVNTVDFPAAYPGVIAVGASALNDTTNPGVRSSATEYVASYSNDGPGLALVAPGGDPSSTSDSDFLHWILNLDTSDPQSSAACADPTNCLALFAGTSQATPHVAGAAALLYSLSPSLTPANVKSILMQNADNINDPRQGAGRLNVYRALAAVSGIAAPTAPGYTNFVAFGYTNSGGTVPNIADSTFITGVPVNLDGTFRLPDINPALGTYHIAVWDDVNGNGIVDAGDYFGSASAACQATSPCTASATGIAVGLVTSGFTLP